MPGRDMVRDTTGVFYTNLFDCPIAETTPNVGCLSLSVVSSRETQPM